MNYDDFRIPGQLIQALLTERGWTQRSLAVVLDMDETVLNHIVAGKKRIDAEMAVVLQEIFNVPAEEFLELQKKYDLAQARFITRPDPHRATRAHLFGGLPVTEMIKRAG